MKITKVLEFLYNSCKEIGDKCYSKIYFYLTYFACTEYHFKLYYNGIEIKRFFNRLKNFLDD